MIIPALAGQTGREYALLRDEEKDHGTENVIEGAEVEGRDVLYVDDVVTSGGSAVEGIQRLEDLGANVIGFLTYVDRQQDRGMERVRYDAQVDVYSVLENEEVEQALSDV